MVVGLIDEFEVTLYLVRRVKVHMKSGYLFNKFTLYPCISSGGATLGAMWSIDHIGFGKKLYI
jgi:hypothetical protein